MVAVEHPDPLDEAKFHADELSSGDEAPANFFGVFQRGMIAGRASCSWPGYLALAVEQRHASVPVWPLATGGIPARLLAGLFLSGTRTACAYVSSTATNHSATIPTM